MEDSTKIIGDRLADGFQKIFRNLTRLSGNQLRARSIFLDFSDLPISQNSTERTCSAAFGCSFAAGTIDGNPVDGQFFQGDTKCINKPAQIFGMLLKRPTDEVVRCHHPKPILLDTGDMKKPWDWSPRILEIQLVQIGSVLVCAVPFEITTMASRRLRQSLKAGL